VLYYIRFLHILVIAQNLPSPYPPSLLARCFKCPAGSRFLSHFEQFIVASQNKLYSKSILKTKNPRSFDSGVLRVMLCFCYTLSSLDPMISYMRSLLLIDEAHTGKLNHTCWPIVLNVCDIVRFIFFIYFIYLYN
jgi:hypothetical protein